MTEPDFTDFPLRRAMRPTLRTWIKHFILFALTLFTATISANTEPFGKILLLSNFAPQSWTEFITLLPFIGFFIVHFFISAVYLVFTEPEMLAYGLKFAFSLLFILTSHEAGHYIACRLYGVDATLPYFLPLPVLSPAGTLGAFIKIMSPLPSRKATFDIGVAGPIAGFIALIPISVIGFLTMKTVPIVEVAENTVEPGMTYYFSDALFTKLMAFLFSVDLTLPIESNPFYFAVWIALLVTSLNLIPSGQLDGGHAVYAVFGEKIHYWTGRVAFVAMVTFSIVGIYLYGTPSALLFTVLLGFMMRIEHPEPLDNTPLDFKRKVVAILTLLIFILCFVPFLIQVK
jgi:membrane-associated protease RseP (regulator of RpoE activity)